RCYLAQRSRLCRKARFRRKRRRRSKAGTRTERAEPVHFAVGKSGPVAQRIKTTQDGVASMSSFALKEVVLAGLLAAVALGSAMAQQAATPPDFSSNLAGWVGLNGGGPFYEPVPGVPGRLSPVVSDPAHPFTPNGVDKQPTFRIADLSNPNLKPWVKAHMKKD